MVGRNSLRVRVLGVGGVSTLAFMMVGCSGMQMQETGTAPDEPLTSAAGMQGKVHGGQQPISGATIQLYQAGLTGYGSLATPLLPTTGTSVVKTDSNGIFNIPSYTCASNSNVYLTAVGGNPGNSSGNVNNQAALVAALGDCATLKANAATTFVQVNEVTTIAAVWALQQFISIVPGTTLYAQPGDGATVSPAFSIGTSSTNLQGLKNAFATANVLANPEGTGLSPGANASGTQTSVEYWQVNTLANILASCVNSDPVAGGTSCGTLETDAKVGTTAPADTLQVAYMIARNPGNNVQALLPLASTVAPYPNSDNYVNDFTIGYAVQPNTAYGIDLGTSSYISFDSYGNAWVANSNVTASSTPYSQTGFISEFDPTGNMIGVPMYQYNKGSASAPSIANMGATLTGNGSTKNQPFLVYIDPSNNAWTTDAANGYVVRIPGSSSAGGANGYNGGAGAFAISTGTGSKPGGLAIDGSGNVYVSLLGSTSSPGYSSTFGSATTGNAVIVPTGTTNGPLTGGSMLPNSLAATTQADYLVVDNTPAATYASAPLLDVITQATCTTTGLGMIEQYFIGPGATVNGSSSNTTTTTDSLTPLNLISGTSTEASCSTKKSSLPDVTVLYDGTTTFMTGTGTSYTIPAIYTPLGSAVDSTGNLWVLNTDYGTTGYPPYGLTKITPNYAASPTTGALTASYTATAVNGGGLPFSTTPEYIAIDGANNVWTTGQQTGTASTDGNGISTNALLGSHYEFDNNGNPLSPSGKTLIKSGTYSSGWFGGNTGSGTERQSQTRRGIAIDLSGNVWTTDAGSQGKTLFILVGAAVPVVTPLSLALKNNTIGVRP